MTQNLRIGKNFPVGGHLQMGSESPLILTGCPNVSRFSGRGTMNGMPLPGHEHRETRATRPSGSTFCVYRTVFNFGCPALPASAGGWAQSCLYTGRRTWLACPRFSAVAASSSAHAYGLSTPTRSPPHLLPRLRNEGSCSSANPPASALTRDGPDSGGYNAASQSASCAS